MHYKKKLLSLLSLLALTVPAPVFAAAPVRAIIVVAAADVAKANAVAATIDKEGGTNTFTVGLSALTDDMTKVGPRFYICEWQLTVGEKGNLIAALASSGIGPLDMGGPAWGDETGYTLVQLPEISIEASAATKNTLFTLYGLQRYDPMPVGP